MPRATGISHILLQVSDLDRAESFFVGLLSMQVKERGHLADGRPLLVLREGLGLTVGPRVGLGESPQDFDHLAFKADDVDGLAEALRRAGVPIVDGPRESPYGRSVYFLDPDGRRIECHTA